MAALLGLLLLLFGAVSPASADDDLRFRRTTPRAEVGWSGASLRLGIPGGRAWGIESALRRVPWHGGTLAATLEVTDPDVREAFLRIAWYERADGRPRQIAIDDSVPVTFGSERSLTVALDPPEGAVAYRVRVLARLRGDAPASRPDAIRVALPRLVRFATPLTRLVPAGP